MTGQIVVNSLSTQNQPPLVQLLMADSIQPGSEPGYQLAKLIYLFHPYGAKIVEAPIELAQSQKREISIPKSPEERVRERYEEQWESDRVDDQIFNTMSLSRTYGAASVAVKIDEDDDESTPLDFTKLANRDVAFPTFDPLNTAGSLVLNQQPNAFDFQKVRHITVSGRAYHPSRTCVMFNERPIYIAYTSAAFGYVGRSAYQRCLFPLQSFVGTMLTDHMVSIKAGLLVMKTKGAGSIVSNVMQAMQAAKRALLKAAAIGNVLETGIDDSVETLNMQNLDGAFTAARNNILRNIATAVPMPAKLLMDEAMVEGFGEGTEDAKNIARYVDRFREKMAPLYAFFDRVTQHRAWTPDYYKTIQDLYPEEYGQMSYQQAFRQWQNSYRAVWPNLLKEPDSELINVEDVKLKAVVAMMEVLIPMMDPDNKARVIQWACDVFNGLKLLFPDPLDLDFESLSEFAETQQQEQAQMQEQADEGEPKPPKPFRGDSQRRGMLRYDEAVAKLRRAADEAAIKFERRREAQRVTH